ncbi:MAG TPA: sulfite exporter TauE/SafE family protein [Acidimicrobiia bacterium]|nr:sulfite exporter TauE/SafE family protein [Acidimicrobiia bacterium]
MTTEFALVLVVIAVAYTVKGVAGMGGPLLAVPFIASVTSVEHAVVVLSLANMVSNGWLLWEHRSGARGTGFVMIPFLGVGTLAVIAGTWILTEIDDRVLSVVVAIVIAAYIWRYLADPAFGLEKETARRIAAPMGLVGGGLLGATGTAGPLIMTYLHSLRMKRASFIHMMSLTFTIFGLIQLVTLVVLGAFTPERTTQAVWAIVPVAAMTALGIRIGRLINHKAFERVVLVLLAIAAVRLLWSALG